MIRLGTVGPCIDPSRRGAVPLACARRWVGVARPDLPPFVFRAGGGGRPRPDACGIAPKVPGRGMSAHDGVGVATGPWVGLPEPRDPRLFPGAVDATQPLGGNGCENERVSIGPRTSLAGPWGAVRPRPPAVAQSGARGASMRAPRRKGATRGAPRTDRACKGGRAPPVGPQQPREPPNTKKGTQRPPSRRPARPDSLSRSADRQCVR